MLGMELGGLVCAISQPLSARSKTQMPGLMHQVLPNTKARGEDLRATQRLAGQN